MFLQITSNPITEKQKKTLEEKRNAERSKPEHFSTENNGEDYNLAKFKRIEELLYYNNIEPKAAPSNSTVESWGQSQDLEGTIGGAGLLSVSRELVHDTADDLVDEEEGLDVWVGFYSPVSTSDDGQDLPKKERSQEDQIRQIRQIRRLQFFFGVDGGLRLDGTSQARQATETLTDWASFYSDQSESMPRGNFLSAPIDGL